MEMVNSGLQAGHTGAVRLVLQVPLRARVASLSPQDEIKGSLTITVVK
jgi:hypothetical protein